MCTSANFITDNGVYCGRNYDYEQSFNESVVIVPRHYKFEYRAVPNNDWHLAMMGIVTGYVRDYPLFYDATNERGLTVCGLNFDGNAVYHPLDEHKINIAPFELIPYLLQNNATVKDARKALWNVNIFDESYSDDLPNSPLHWMVSDANGDSIVIESTINGLKVYDNPVGVLTNNPPFPYQLSELNKYRGLSVENPQNTFGVELDQYSRGMGAYGLCGDYSSTSRFVKASFIRANALESDKILDDVHQFFHILGSVEQVNGLTLVDKDKYEYTIYSDCYHNSGLYFKSYYDHNIWRVEFDDADYVKGDELEFIMDVME